MRRVRFVLTCRVQYNAVRVFDHKIRTPSISNTLWIGFYLFVFLGSLSNALRYALHAAGTLLADRWLEVVSLTMHGLSTAMLSLTLNHQRRFRSSGGAGGADDVETDPLLRRYDRLRSHVSPPDVLFVLLFVVYEVFAFLPVLGVAAAVLRWVFLGLFLAQRLPPLLLTVLIIFFPKPTDPEAMGTVTEAYVAAEGPSGRAKALLGFATLFSVAGDVPLSLWSLAFGQDCVFWVASGVDLVHLLYVVGLVLYFFFLRSEYHRNMEECIWKVREMGLSPCYLIRILFQKDCQEVPALL